MGLSNMTQEKNSKLFEYLRKIFLHFGVWNLCTTHNLFTIVLYKSYSFLLNSIVILASISFILNVYFANQLSSSVFAMYVGATATTTMTAIKIILWKPNNLNTLYRRESELFNTQDDNLSKIHEKTSGPIFKVLFIYMISIALTNITFSGVCGYFYYNSRKEKFHPFEMLLPFDRDQFYGISLIIYVLTESITAFMAYVMDMSILVFIIYQILRLKYLQQILRHHKHYYKIQRKNDGSQFESLIEFWEECIVEHQNIICEIDSLSKQTTTLFFIDFFLRIVQTAGFCLGGFKAEDYLNKVFCFGCLLCCNFQLTVLYWYGEALSTESVVIGDKIYESLWYEADIKVQKIIIMMLKRSQNASVLTVGKFEKVAVRTVLKIFKSVYSCMSILIQRN